MARLTPVVHLCYWRLASASADHATTLQVPSTKKAGLPMVDATCKTRRCCVHVSSTIELNPQYLACATLHAKLCCLFFCPPVHAAGQGRARVYNPSPSLLAARLDASCGPSPAYTCLLPGGGQYTAGVYNPSPSCLPVLMWALAQESWQSCLQTRHVW